MADEQLSVPDLLASITADMDQAQATIDEARAKFPNHIAFQKKLDEQQFQLDLKRQRVRIARLIEDILED